MSSEKSGNTNLTLDIGSLISLWTLLAIVCHCAELGMFTVFTIKMPFLGCMTAMFLSHFSGNGIGWNILHFFCSWFYVFYRFAEKAAEILK